MEPVNSGSMQHCKLYKRGEPVAFGINVPATSGKKQERFFLGSNLSPGEIAVGSCYFSVFGDEGFTNLRLHLAFLQVLLSQLGKLINIVEVSEAELAARPDRYSVGPQGRSGR